MITIFPNFYDMTGYDLSVNKALDRIKRGNSKELIEKLREMPNSNDAETSKRSTFKRNNLHCTMFSGTFNYRSKAGLDAHSKFICLDFDKLKNVKGKIDELKEDKFIYSAWVSPSGDGVKALVKVEATDIYDHEDYWYSIKEKYIDIDPACKDASRICYESYDPDLFINKEAKVWKDKKERPKLMSNEKVDFIVAESTDYETAKRSLDIIARCNGVEKHEALCRAAFLMGGFVSGGIVEENIGVSLLENEISKYELKSFEDAQVTISKAMEAGKHAPVDKDTEMHVESLRMVTTSEADEIFSDYAEFKVGDETKIKESVVILTVNGERVLAEGEILTLSGIMKAGKSGLTSAIIAKIINPNAKGFDIIKSVSPNRPILHFDTEQPIERHRLNQRFHILARAEIDRLPDNYFSYNLRKMNVKKRKEAVENLSRACKVRHGDVGVIVIDGIADFIDDVNDPKQSTPLVDWLLFMATEYNCGIIPVIHINASSGKEGYSVKQRGHLGSELQRRTDSMLVVDWEDKESERSVLYAQFLRSGSVVKFGKHTMVYDTRTNMHQIEDASLSLMPRLNNKYEDMATKIMGLKRIPAKRLLVKLRLASSYDVAEKHIKDMLNNEHLTIEDEILKKKGLTFSDRQDPIKTPLSTMVDGKLIPMSEAIERVEKQNENYPSEDPAPF